MGFLLLALLNPSPDLAASSRRLGEDLLLTYVREHWDGHYVPSPDRIPSFSRQTGLSCSLCHTGFPQLTAFGRDFKLNGYTLLTQPTIEQKDSVRTRLRLGTVPPVSAMFIASATRTARSQPAAQNNNAEFPQEMGFFVGGSVTPNLGGFFQVTYDPADGTVALDNVDLRLAKRSNTGGKPVTYGLSLNNNPSVQDLWNTAPAWSFPFTSSAVAPSPAAAVTLDGGLGQAVVGLGGYLLWNGLVYAEITAYRSAPQGAPNPPDGDSEWTVKGIAPYWRLALQRNLGRSYLQVGTFGLAGAIYPDGVSGPTDKFTDLAFDAQFERPVSGGSLTARTIWIHEEKRLDASFATGLAARDKTTLRTLRLDATYLSSRQIGVTLGVQNLSGEADHQLYPPGPLTGSRTGKPNATGLIGELSWMPWLNTRVGAQYTRWTIFNGAEKNYDGSGRGSGDNDTLYVYLWFAF